MIAPPDTLIAELTYACPLRCGYCSNPTSYPPGALDTASWVGAIEEAEQLGVLQLHLTGGEPLLREDLERLVEAGRARGLYVNLITSAVPATPARLERLAAAGLDHVQLSFQSARAGRCDDFAGRPVYEAKLAAATTVRRLGLPLTLNVVLHRGNLDEIGEIVALAERLGASRLELANAQYLGSALVNREQLLPNQDQLEHAKRSVDEARARLAGRMELVFVLPDYVRGRPRACMDGWARRYMVVAPDGRVLPCQAAHGIPGLTWERVGDRPLASIWRESEALNRFRGDAWMPAPCRTCDERHRDHAGCRCQAFALCGDAAAPDPACARVPSHALVRAVPQGGPAIAGPGRRFRVLS